MIKLVKVAEPLHNAFAKALEPKNRKRSYLVENSSDEDDFLNLIARSRCVDRAGYQKTWRKRFFTHGRGYSQFRQYKPQFIEREGVLSTKELLIELDIRFLTHQATTRELILFYIHHNVFVEALLSQGKKLVGLGRDELNTGHETAPVIYLDGDQRVLDKVKVWPGQWDKSHVILSRSK